MSVNPVPETLKGAIPYLAVHNAKDARAFYKKPFGAEETLCIEHKGKAGHAELAIFAAKIMLYDEFPEHETLSPKTIGGMPVLIHLYAGEPMRSRPARPKQNSKRSSRSKTGSTGGLGGNFEDPFGHR